MLRYDTLQLRLRQGSELRLSPAWIHEVIISHYFENSLLAGGLAASLQKVRFLLRYDSDGQWMDVGWMSTGNRILMNGDLIEYQCYEKCLRYNGQPMK